MVPEWFEDTELCHPNIGQEVLIDVEGHKYIAVYEILSEGEDYKPKYVVREPYFGSVDEVFDVVSRWMPIPQ